MAHMLGAWGGKDIVTLDQDDTVDRMSHRTTVQMLVVFAVFATGSQFLYGNPIVCWVPAHFTDNHEEYTNSYCWVGNTYYLPFEEYIPKENEPEKRDMIPYYQWVPVMLLVQALMFCLPYKIWQTFNNRSGLEISDVMERGKALKILADDDDDKARDKVLKNIATQFTRYVQNQYKAKSKNCTFSFKHIFSRTCCRCCGHRFGNYLFTLYVFCKFLYLVNAIGQLFLLNAFLDMDFHKYGFKMLSIIFKGDREELSPTFPRITMCDFKLRRIGNLQRYTVQCALPVNMFNEKIFLVIYFWFLLVALATLYSFLVWIFRVTPPRARYSYIKKKLRSKLQNLDEPEGEDFSKDVKEFTEKFLHHDGVFILRLVNANSDLLSGEDIIHKLWEKYMETETRRNLLYPELSSIEEE